MWTYIVKRVLTAIPTLLVISFMIFSLLYITPGDPVLLMLGSGDTQSVSEEQYLAVQKELGLDKPFLNDILISLQGRSGETWEPPILQERMSLTRS